MNKEKEIFDEITDMICWAEDQNHITENAKTILLQNLEKIKEKYTQG